MVFFPPLAQLVQYWIFISVLIFLNEVEVVLFSTIWCEEISGSGGARVMDDGGLPSTEIIAQLWCDLRTVPLVIASHRFSYCNLILSSGKNSQIAVHRIQSRACLLSHYHINDLFIHFTFHYSCTYSLFSLFAYNSIKFNLQNMSSSDETLVNPALFWCFFESDVLLLRVCGVSEAPWCSLTQREAVLWEAFSAMPEKLIKGFAEPVIASDLLVAGNILTGVVLRISKDFLLTAKFDLLIEVQLKCNKLIWRCY